MSERDLRQEISKRSLTVTKAVLLPAVVLDALIIIKCWPDEPRRWVAIGIVAVWGFLNALLFPRLSRKKGPYRIARIRETANTLGQIAKAWIGYASIPTWGFLLAFASMTDRTGSVFSRQTVLLQLFFQVIFSVYYNVPWFQIVALSGVTIIAMTVSISRSAVLQEAASNQRRQRQRLEQLQEVATYQEKMSSLGILAAGIAHEINNPMAFITSNINQLAKDLPHLCSAPDLHEEYMEEVLPEIKDGITRVNTIVDDLRRFARGDVEARSTFDVNDVVRSAVRMSHGRVAPGVSLSLSLDDIPYQSGYPRQLSQVVVNLLVNAIQAVADGGTISIRSGCLKGAYWFQVKDNGPGMDKDTQSRIYEPFFTTKPIGEGTGLGLAVVHGIVEQLNGYVEVESEPGKGASFKVTVPRRDDGEDTGVFTMRVQEQRRRF